MRRVHINQLDMTLGVLLAVLAICWVAWLSFPNESARATPLYLVADPVPLYRFWSPVHECHFYTVSETERAKLIEQYGHVWTYECIACYVHRPPAQQE